MSGNIYGTLFRLATYGESHGPAIGGVIDGCPAGITLDFEAIQRDLNRRKPGQSAIVTQRKEPDEVSFYSGIFEGKTTGTPIGFAIHNTNQKSHDYSHIKDSYRPSHADKSLTITPILKTATVLLMPIMFMMKNTASEITEVEEGVQHVKQQVE